MSSDHAHLERLWAAIETRPDTHEASGVLMAQAQAEMLYAIDTGESADVILRHLFRIRASLIAQLCNLLEPIIPNTTPEKPT